MSGVFAEPHVKVLAFKIQPFLKNRIVVGWRDSPSFLRNFINHTTQKFLVKINVSVFVRFKNQAVNYLYWEREMNELSHRNRHALDVTIRGRKWSAVSGVYTGTLISDLGCFYAVLELKGCGWRIFIFQPPPAIRQSYLSKYSFESNKYCARICLCKMLGETPLGRVVLWLEDFLDECHGQDKELLALGKMP